MNYRHAFSLVEVIIALGIISFGLMAVLGLVPIGLTAMRRAMDASIEKQIVQKITGEVLSTPFSQLSSAIVDKPYYFDEQGIALTASGSARYQVVVQDGLTVYPGSTEAPMATPVTASLRMLKVKVNAGSNLQSATSTYYQILVANTGT